MFLFQEAAALPKVMLKSKSEAGDAHSAAGTGTAQAGEPAPLLERKAPSHD